MTQLAVDFRMWLILGASLFARDVQSQDNVRRAADARGILRPADARDSDPLVQRIRKSGGQPGFAGDKIVRLGVYEPQGDDHSFQFLKELADLEELDINCTNSGEWVQHIVTLPKLSRVLTYRAGLTDHSCEFLAELTQLRELTLDVNEITDAGIAKVAGMANLEELHLRHVPVTDKGLVSLSRLPKLKVLSLDHTNISPEGVLALRDSQIEDLRWWVDPRYPNNALLPYVSQLPNLKRLDLSGRNVADEEVTHVGKMAGLEELELSEHCLTDKGMVHLAGLKNLKRLGLAPGGDRIGDAGVKHLSNLVELTSLSLTYTKVTDAGLQHLTGLRKLNSLYLGDTLVTAAGIKTLAQLPSLEHLDITGTSMEDADQLDFRKMRGLKRLVAYGFDEGVFLLPDGCYVTTFD